LTCRHEYRRHGALIYLNGRILWRWQRHYQSYSAIEEEEEEGGGGEEEDGDEGEEEEGGGGGGGEEDEGVGEGGE
jgi:hypothetical protein